MTSFFIFSKCFHSKKCKTLSIYLYVSISTIDILYRFLGSKFVHREITIVQILRLWKPVWMTMTLVCVNFFPKVKGLSSDILSWFYAEFKNIIHCAWSGLVFKSCLNSSQNYVHNNNAYSKACEFYLLQLIVGSMFHVYLTRVYSPTRKHSLERAGLIP